MLRVTPKVTLYLVELYHRLTSIEQILRFLNRMSWEEESISFTSTSFNNSKIKTKPFIWLRHTHWRIMLTSIRRVSHKTHNRNPRTNFVLRALASIILITTS